MAIKDARFGIEASIQEAMLRGDFDNLKGKGKPIDLQDYFDTPEESRITFSLLRSNGFIPPELELRQEITQLKETLAASPDPGQRKELTKLINEKQLAFDLLIETHRRRGRGK